MKKNFWKIIMVVIVMLTLAACGGKSVETVEMVKGALTEAGLPDLGGREIIVAVENAYPPFNYIDTKTGEPGGWDYDVWTEICGRMNCVPVMTEASWDGMIQAVSEGQYDVAGDGITITEKRDEIVDFSNPYVAIEQRLLVRKDETRITSMDDVVANEDIVFSTQFGSSNYEVAVQFLPEDRIQAFEQFPFAVQSLLSGDVDAVLIDEKAGMGYLGVNANDLKLVGPSLSSDGLGFVFPEGSELIEPINLALAQIMSDGWLDDVNMLYFGPEFVDPSAE